MSQKSERCKCRCCSTLFLPEYRNRGRQRYCQKPECRRASKAASQRRWLRKPINRDYFRDAKNVERVQAWRKAHPGYWRKKSKKTAGSPSPPTPDSQGVQPEQSSCNVPGSPSGTLQDVCLTKNPAFIGLIAMVSGRTLPDDIETITHRVVDQGLNILGLTVPPGQANTKTDPDYDSKTSAPSRSAAASPGQL